MRPARPHRLLAVALATVALATCKKEQGSGLVGPGAKGPIVVGHVASVTGTEATFGLSSDRGVRLFFEGLNARGGIRGRLVKVVTLDDQGKPEEAATAATRLIASDHVTAMLGEVSSTRSKYMAPKAQMAKVPMITPSSTNEEVTKIGDYIFRACFIDPFQAYVMARFARDQLKASRVAILKDVRNDYSMGLARNFAARFTAMGGQIAGEEGYSNGDVDFKAQLTNLKAQDIQALVVPGYYTDVGLIARQAREVGIAVPLLGGDGWDSDKLWEIGGAAIEGSYFSNHYAADDPDLKMQARIGAFVAAYQKAFNAVPDSFAASAYDAAGMLANAMERAADLSGPAIRDALAATKGFAGVTGDITIDENRNPVKSAAVLRVAKGGKHEYVTRIMPEAPAPAPAPAPAAAPAPVPAPAAAPK